jgi:hypothetical protein
MKQHQMADGPLKMSLMNFLGGGKRGALSTTERLDLTTGIHN